MGYTIQDLNGDGVPELAIGFTPEYGAYLSALFTLAEGTPRLVFGEAGDGYTYLQDGSFFYNGCRSASENGKGIYQFTDDGTALICREFYFYGSWMEMDRMQQSIIIPLGAGKSGIPGKPI